MRKPPPLLLGATLLFWGWQAGFLPMALLLATLVEGVRLTKVRWEISDQEFTRIWTFCALLFLALAIYAFSSNDAPTDVLNLLQNPHLFNQQRAGEASSLAIASLIRWLPMIFFPFLAAGTYSAREGIPLQTISLILQWRWKQARKAGLEPPPSQMVDIGYPYFVLCLVSASIRPAETTEFFWGSSVLVAWALWPQRSRRFAPVVWVFTLSTAVGLGYFGQAGIRSFQQYVGNFNPFMFSHFGRRGFDPTRNRTSIGHIGRVQASGKIVMRVEPKENSKVPSLLREAAYRTYRSESWYSGNSRGDFVGLTSETNQTTWVLAPGAGVTVPVNIACYLDGGVGLLPLPEDTARLENLPAFVLQRNSLGAVLAQGPGLIIFDAYHGPGIQFDDPPDDTDDLSVPAREVPALEQIIIEAGLAGLPQAAAMRKLDSFFQSKFTYSTWLESPAGGGKRESALSRFLLQTRRGHCEYFATATVLLLRQLGFPARYAVGYAVHESVGGNRYVVRQRDAHAWCLTWRDGLWRQFDTTPASWFEREEANASPFQGLSDFWSRIVFEFSRLRYGQSNLRQYLLWVLGVVLLVLLVQIVFARRRKRVRPGVESEGTLASWPGLDSEFYRLEQHLAARGFPRSSGEPLASWLSRSAADPVLAVVRPELQELLQLHYQYRFDPLGLAPAERHVLRSRAEICLGRLSDILGSSFIQKLLGNGLQFFRRKEPRAAKLE